VFCIRKKYYKSKQILFSWLIVLLVFCVGLGYIYIRIQPVILRYAHSQAETIMLNSANEAVVKILKNNDFSYGDIAVLTRDSGGNVKSLEIDTYKINYLKSNISNEISNIISKKERYTVGIPIGTFFDNSFTAGFGPDVKFKMQMTSTAFVDFEHEFRDAGINQVLHRVVVKITINGSLLIAGYKRNISVNTSAIAAQTVIVGAVPEGFTNVIENENDNTAGLINDYGVIGE